MAIKPPIGKIKKNLLRMSLNTGDSMIRAEFYMIENSKQAVLIIPPDPNWLDNSSNQLNKLVMNLMEDLESSKIPSCSFNFTKYPIVQNNYNKYIAQASSCLEEMMRKFEINRNIWVVGYSFGALIALNLAIRRPEIKGFIMISPPLLYQYDFFSWISSYSISGLLVYGSNDELITKNVADAYVSFLAKKYITTDVIEIPEAGHKFTDGQYKILQEHIINYIKTH